MVRVCLQCNDRVPDSDDEYGACQNTVRGVICGSTQWAIVDAPQKDYRLSQNDRRFLKSIRVLPEH